ncbi:Tyrosine-protein phosphatase YwqE [Jeotgalicoccus saudimassiliensis]|uniref:Tyrosine-protein phosphatase n=1 Tax=Jeotgalicoccus saudimassiliensis TaxID=1461582 RepID=A0A078M577_9STAP|nr:CpsB/CapC family capsule biosynthesis tyrosine phosphatase [Jeotgalicoccus saudimassiliensis]CEA00497.1 Tyrosine-protein phosphatase YwqE [Jeotgalicoccus saudimassiliensis]
MIDIHNHLLVGADDGPATKQDALDLLHQAQENGITDIIVTPHHYSGDFVNPKSKILTDMEELKSIISQNDININVYPGQEIRINGDLVEELEAGLNLSLNHSSYVLVEFPFTEVPAYAEKLFFELQMKGYAPVIAHPERCRPLKDNLEKLYDFIEKGAIAQVTATSVAGKLGEGLQRASLKMIENNLIHIVGSDAHHAENRPFLLKEAYEIIEEELGASYVKYLKYNAEAILHNKEVKVKAPVQYKSDSKKVKKRKKFLGLF